MFNGKIYINNHNKSNIIKHNVTLIIIAAQLNNTS